MAQRTEKEETEFKVPETLTLCVNNCGSVTGNPATNMCQKCFNATTTTTTVAASTTTAVAATSSSTDLSSSSSSGSGILTKSPRFNGISPRSRTSRLVVRDPSPESIGKKADTSSFSDREKAGGGEVCVAKREVNRCSGCKRRVGLTGFRCRCGEIFCSEHRYSDRHDCSYDYKTAGREAIARENPVVKAAKIVRV